jgi:hypothetical protein
MSLAPVIVIGCGGSGGKVVLDLKRRIGDELQRRNWTGGIPQAWQFRWIDVPTAQERHPEFGPPLAAKEYVALAPSDNYRQIDEQLCQGAGQNLDRLMGWRPGPHLGLPVSRGAGQMRAVGRAVALTRPAMIADSIRVAINDANTGMPELDILDRFLADRDEEITAAEPQTPLVFVVSSLAGGTGSGIYLDVCEIVRKGFPDLANGVLAVLFTAEVFKGVELDGGMAPNTVASFAELGAGALSGVQKTEPLLGAIGPQAVEGHGGPNATFVVGLSPLGNGPSLRDASDCYRAVTETLVATMMNSKFAGDFAAYQLTNFYQSNGPNERETKWSMLNQPLGLGLPSACGYVSSFGSARLSVGSARFGEWAIDRMARSAIDYLTDGWRERGLELLDPLVRDSASDQQIVDFLVKRDRNRFIEACGLWEEDEPDQSGSHDQVLEGITEVENILQLRNEFRSTLFTELSQAGDGNEGQWSGLIAQVVTNRSGAFGSLVERHVEEGRDRYAETLIDRVSDATSKWLAEYGLPVTSGLVDELIEQCSAAVTQLQQQAAESRSKTTEDATAYIRRELGNIGKNRVAASSEYVARALDKALGPILWNAARIRQECAIDLIKVVRTRLLDPLRAELRKIGHELEHAENQAEIEQWPSGPDIAELYRPPASEFCLMDVNKWDDQYQSLLGRSEGGSAEAVRDLILAGGYEYGPVAKREQAPKAVTIEANGTWWTRDGRAVAASLRLAPSDVNERVRTWMTDDSHTFGRFMKSGLSDYLADDHEDVNRRARLDQLRVQLDAAIKMARPLFSIKTEVMQRVHSKSELKEQVLSEDFPFSGSHPAREIVEQMTQSSGFDAAFREDNNAGIESVLILSNLVNPVQPNAVESIYGPIGKAWLQATQVDIESRQAQINGFNFNRRARLLTEAIPLPSISIESICKGWFLGRLLGTVTDPTLTEPVRIWSKNITNEPTAAAMPWPVLHHGDVAALDRPTHRGELLPAFLEHVGLAMMMVSHDDTALDGYQSLFQLGQNAEAHIADWIEDGETSVGQNAKPKLKGTDPQSRKDEMLNALSELQATLKKREEEGERLARSSAYEDFVQVPFGWELIPTQRAALSSLTANVSSLTLGEGSGFE